MKKENKKSIIELSEHSIILLIAYFFLQLMISLGVKDEQGYWGNGFSIVIITIFYFMIWKKVKKIIS